MSTVGNWRGANIVKQGLVLYLDPGSPNSFYNKSGTVIKDISGNNFNGTLTNGPTYSSTNGGSIVFDGTNHYIITPGSILNSSYTLQSWIYMNGNRFTILNNFSDDANVKSNQFGTDGSRNVYFQISLNNNTYFYTTSTSTLNVNQWYNVCFTRTGSTAKIYINGVEILISVAGSSALDLQTYTSNFAIGVNRSSNYTNGSISSLKLYNRALTAAEVLQNFNATKSRFSDFWNDGFTWDDNTVWIDNY